MGRRPGMWGGEGSGCMTIGTDVPRGTYSEPKMLDYDRPGYRPGEPNPAFEEECSVSGFSPEGPSHWTVRWTYETCELKMTFQKRWLEGPSADSRLRVLVKGEEMTKREADIRHLQALVRNAVEHGDPFYEAHSP